MTDPRSAGPSWPARDVLAKMAEVCLGLRRSGRAVRHDDQSLAHLPELGSDQRLESLLGVHVPGRHGLQPGEHQPDEVPPGRRHVRRRAVHRPPAGCSSSPRKSWSITPAIRPSGSPRTAIVSARWDLGYSNLGSLIMTSGLAYDSDAARGRVRGHDGPAARRGQPGQRRAGRGGRAVRRFRASIASRCCA